MWEIEALMENTVRLIDKSEFIASKKRNLIWNTYHLQNQFDCSFTHFRLMDLLIKNEYVQQYDISDFPMTSAYPNLFNELSNKDFEWIHENPNEKWSENNLEIAYWDKKSNKIFVDYGSKFYTKYKEENIEEYEPLRLAYLIIKEGSKQKDKSIIYNWTAFMINYLLAWFPTTKLLNELKDEYVIDIKNTFDQFDFTNYKAIHHGLDINNINEDWLEDMSETQKELIQYFKQK